MTGSRATFKSNQLYLQCSHCTYTNIDITAQNKDKKAGQIKVGINRQDYFQKIKNQDYYSQEIIELVHI